jgi:hypothetical protein
MSETAGIGADAWYVYGLLPASLPAPLAAAAPGGAAILPDSRVEALPVGGLAVLASRVPRRLFDRDDPANRTADPDWMGARVRAYHAACAAAGAATPFLPLAFGTLFSSLDRLGGWLAPREAALRAALARVAGHGEWQLALQADAAAHAAWLDGHDPALRDLAAQIAAAGQGTAFLLARRLETARAAARTRHLAATAGAVAAALDRAAAVAGLRVLAEPARDLPAWSVLAPLAEPARWPDLLAPLACELDASGLALRLTGPWPAYAFARAALAGEDSDG